eukprot:27279-Rhodomonas_salina.1
MRSRMKRARASFCPNQSHLRTLSVQFVPGLCPFAFQFAAMPKVTWSFCHKPLALQEEEVGGGAWVGESCRRSRRM